MGLMDMPVEELERRARLPFRLFPDLPSLLTHFAQSIAEEIRTHNQRGEPTRLIVPVGPVAQYPQLAEITNRERLTWKNVFLFQMDEFLDWQGRPLPVSHPLSFEGCLRTRLLAAIDEDLRPPAEHLVVPHPFHPDRISERLREVGGIDACYGGVGYHGHVAFNEPPNTRWRRISEEELRASLTRVVVLGSDSIVVQSIMTAGGAAAAIPPMAVTLGMKDILASRKIRLYLAGGERHRAIFRIAVAGEVSTDYPVTLVQGHPDAQLYTDQATAAPIFPTSGQRGSSVQWPVASGQWGGSGQPSPSSPATPQASDNPPQLDTGHRPLATVIDFHAHYPNEPDFIPRLLDLLPQAGIDRICLCSAGEMFGHVTNDEVRRAFELHPDRVIGLAFLDLGRDRPEVVDQYAAQGFRGFKIHNPAAAYDDKSFYPVYERIERSGLPALFHTGIVMCTCHDKERDVSSDKMRPVRLDAVVRAFKGMNVVGAHLGVPWYEEASMMARLHPNYYVDLTGAWWAVGAPIKDPTFTATTFSGTMPGTRSCSAPTSCTSRS